MEERKIFVGNLPPTSFTDKNLIDFFQKFGNVVDAFIIRDAQSNVGRRCGFVTFEKRRNSRSLEATLLSSSVVKNKRKSIPPNQ
jgi:RNA recognition motif-containing protein